jgi:hypothetical protein
MFYQIALPQSYDFARLIDHVTLEDITAGRKGAILVRPDARGRVPLVRSTTNYQRPSQCFRPVISELADRIAQAIASRATRDGTEVPHFNNAMLELYTDRYRSMGYHTDQSLDLQDDSWICLFTCYNHPPNPSSLRVLRVQNKTTLEERDYVLQHNSIVFFSTASNAQHVHKIILPHGGAMSDTVWLGLTLRTSKSFLTFAPGHPPQLSMDTESAAVPLRVASDEERRQLCHLKSQENRELAFTYPPGIDYTISVGDTLNVVPDETFLRLDHVLVLHQAKEHPDLEYIASHFAGKVIRCDKQPQQEDAGTADVVDIHVSPSSLLFLAGNVGLVRVVGTSSPESVFVVQELSYGYEDADIKQVVTLGQIPINIHGVGILFRQFFTGALQNIFARIQSEHEFQHLTESNKPGRAFRTGLYITDVTSLRSDINESQENENEIENEDGNALSFRLLRCSSNFTGPTEGLQPTDKVVIDQVNRTAQHYMDTPVDLNHVLAQIYDNSQGKAKIKRHADKTKDMPKHGAMAFCTFYDDDTWHPKVHPGKSDAFDRCYKDTSVLTTLHFELKQSEEHSEALPRAFDVTLYPNSVLLIPLSTNRIYTHEIRPSVLPLEFLPTRMGYVIRCSRTVAVYRNGTTFVPSKQDGTLHALQQPTAEDMHKLRNLYFRENATAEHMDYGDIFFSMNLGDFMQPTKSHE